MQRTPEITIDFEKAPSGGGCPKAGGGPTPATGLRACCASATASLPALGSWAASVTPATVTVA